MSYLDLKGAMRNYLVDRGYSVHKVTKYLEKTQYGGYCETCVYTEYFVDIYYLDSDGKDKVYEYYGGLAELIRELTD